MPSNLIEHHMEHAVVWCMVYGIVEVRTASQSFAWQRRYVTLAAGERRPCSANTAMRWPLIANRRPRCGCGERGLRRLYLTRKRSARDAVVAIITLGFK